MSTKMSAPEAGRFQQLSLAIPSGEATDKASLDLALSMTGRPIAPPASVRFLAEEMFLIH